MRQICLLLCLTWASLLAVSLPGCGPSELPAFANPPPDDQSDDSDAGERESR